MAVFQVDVQTKAGAIYISNIWHVNAADLAAAHIQAGNLAVAHAMTIPSFWAIDYIRTSTPAPGDGAYIAQPINIPGTRSTPGQILPYFNRFRVTFSVGFRRPLTKYLIGVGEADCDGDQFTNAVIAEFQAGFVNAVVNGPTLDVCSPGGLPVLSGGLNTAVGMHQLRRASKRRTPVIS